MSTAEVLQSCFVGDWNPDLPIDLFVRQVSEYLELYSNGNVAASLAYSFDTLFGSFSVRTWADNTGIKNITLRAHLRGTALVIIRLRPHDGTPIELARQEIDGENGPEIDLRLSDGIVGIIYPIIIPMSEEFELTGIQWCTFEKKVCEPVVAVVIPTYKREVQVKRNANRLASLAREGVNLRVFVIDNACSLQDWDLEGATEITVVPNRNLGGSGGFARGLYEAESANQFTHVVMCDDDADIESESLKRSVAFFSFSKEEVYLGGMMLYQHQRDFIHEAGALVSGPNSFLSRKHGSSAINPQDLAKLDVQEPVEYFGWYLVGFPIAAVRNLGFPAPFFIRFDDQEYGFRLLGNGYKAATLMGFCVWHEAFHLRDSQLTHYYLTRNGLVSMFAHRAEIAPRTLLRQVRGAFWRSMLTLRYDRASMILAGLQDCLRGPTFIDTVNAEELNGLLLSKQRQPIRLVSSDALGIPFKVRQPKAKRFKRLLSKLTLGGHLLPSVLTRRRRCAYINADDILGSSTADKIFYFEPIIGLGWVAERDRWRFFLLLIRSASIFSAAYWHINSVARSHRQKLLEISARDNWRRRFQIPVDVGHLK